MGKWMTVVGDLHGRLPSIREDSYLCLLAGDICPDDDQEAFLDGPFRAWLQSLPCPCIGVPGNHDKIMEDPNSRILIDSLPMTLFLRAGCIYTASHLRIFGIPGALDGSAFRTTEEEYDYDLASMPNDVDVLLLHNPPAGVLDSPSHANHIGSFSVRYHIMRKKPKLVVFGHVHEARGYKRIGSTYFVNATMGAGCNKTGKPVAAPYGPWGLADNSWRKES